MMSAAFSAIMMMGMLMLPLGICGMTEPSTTRRPWGQCYGFVAKQLDKM
jgi:hypothetical protein